MTSSVFSVGSFTGCGAELGGIEGVGRDRRGGAAQPPAAETGPPPTGAELKPPGPPDRSSSGDSEAVMLLAASASGRWSASQPAGWPTASTTLRWMPEFIFLPELRIDAPSIDEQQDDGDEHADERVAGAQRAAGRAIEDEAVAFVDGHGQIL